VLALAVLAANDSEARLYQWRNPKTGLSHLSGMPPSWYRVGSRGPRVLVFENGVLVDDTALPVREERAVALRQAAFDEANQRRELAALQRLEEAARRETDKAARKARVEERRKRAVAERTKPADSKEPALGSLEQFGAETIKKLKALIAEFDRSGGDTVPKQR